MTTPSHPFTVVLLYGGALQVITTDASDAYGAAHRFTHDPITGHRWLDANGQPDARLLAVFAGHHNNLLEK